MEESSACVNDRFLGRNDNSLNENQTKSLLPRPCSMPCFDKSHESIEKRNLQTLPFKSSSKRSLSFKPWKSMSSSCGSFLTSPTFGTPSYPAHLDTIRAKSACLSTADVAKNPEEVNNNYIYASDNELNADKYDQNEADMFHSDKNLAESLHSFSYTNGFTRGTFANSPAPGLSSSLNASWQFFNFIGGADTGTALPTTTRNPNKALLTIDAKTSKILVANEIACKLFGYQSEVLTGMKISKLFAMKDGIKHDALLEQHIDTEGTIVMVSGKVIEAVDSAGNIIAVSLWMKRFKSDDDPRCIAIIEPVQRSVGSVLFNAEGTIVDCDCQFAYLHGYTSPEEVVGLLIQNLIPSIMLPIPGQEIKKHVKKQRATGKARNNSRFPVSIRISEYDKDFHELYLRRGEPDEIQFSKFLYKGIIWVFANISGLVSVLPDGKIHSCNSNFSLMLFGCSEEELIGKNIATLIPSFYDQMDLAEDRSLKIPSLSEDEEVQLDPNRDTALSGKFEFESSSQSDFDSDLEGHYGETESLNALSERGYSHDSSSDQTATSSVTIGSSHHNLSETSSHRREFIKSSSPIKEEHHKRSSNFSNLFQNQTNFNELSTEVIRISSPIKGPKISENSNENKNEHGRKDSDSSYVSVTTLKSDSSCCADSTERSSIGSSCNKSCCRSEQYLTTNVSELRNHESSPTYTDYDGGDSEKSPISITENFDVNYDRKKLIMTSGVSDDDNVKLGNENKCEDVKAVETLVHSKGDVPQELEIEDSRTVSDGRFDKEELIVSLGLKSVKEVMLKKQESFEVEEELTRSSNIERLSTDVKSKLGVSSDKSSGEVWLENEEKVNLAHDTSQLQDGHRKFTSKDDDPENIDHLEALKNKPEISPGESIGDINLENEEKVNLVDDNSPSQNGHREFSSSDDNLEKIDHLEATENKPGISPGESIGDVNIENEEKMELVDETSWLPGRHRNHSKDDVPESIKHQEAIPLNYSETLHSNYSSEVNCTNRGNEFVTENGSVIVDYVNDVVIEPLSPKKRVQNANDERFTENEKVTTNNYQNRIQQEQFTSTPKLDRSNSQCPTVYEGSFYGQAKHKDDSLLPIVFQVKQITLNRGKEMFCIWISRDPEDQEEGYRIASQLMLTGSFNSTLNTSLGNFADAMKSYNDLNMSMNEDNQTFKGKYGEKYMTLKSIGKGAFGFVKLAQRRSDSLEVVVKFIQKSKIVPASWIDDPALGRVPLEVAFLAKLEHPNIVKMHEVFENDDFFQLVMEKHGEGIDLFEFIDRQPALDEPICAYMFRQILSAVSYLHSKNILHRDVKDENVIIDKTFTLKLIDFGSAVFMEKGKLFSTFCGTVEYCSPEVLLGNKYHGPELEVWSLGITLYTVVFGENPFFDVEETIKAELQPPFKVAAELMFLICWMLHPEPNLRATIKDIESYRWVNQKVDISFYNYDTIFPENKDEYNTDQEDHSLEFENNNYDDDDDYDDYLQENELLEEEYLKYLTRQRSIPDHPEREHGASF